MNAKNIGDDVLKTLRIRRYTLLRYLVSIIFFVGLYRSINYYLSKSGIIILLPIIICISMLIILWGFNENINGKSESLEIQNKLTYFNVFLAVAIFILTIINYKWIFPFLVSFRFAIIIALIYLSLVLLLLYSIWRIINNKDRTYKLYEEYVNKVNKKNK